MLFTIVRHIGESFCWNDVGGGQFVIKMGSSNVNGVTLVIETHRDGHGRDGFVSNAGVGPVKRS